MSRRSSIINALTEEIKKINGLGEFKTDLYGAAYPFLKFWDEVNNFPSVYVAPGSESREYHPAGFKWGFLNVSIKVYIKQENPQTALETLLEDIEQLLDNLRGCLVYDASKDYQTTDISISSIVTDEGLLDPYGVGEINLSIRYQIM